MSLGSLGSNWALEGQDLTGKDSTAAGPKPEPEYGPDRFPRPQEEARVSKVGPRPLSSLVLGLGILALLVQRFRFQQLSLHHDKYANWTNLNTANSPFCAREHTLPLCKVVENPGTLHTPSPSFLSPPLSLSLTWQQPPPQVPPGNLDGAIIP